MMQPASTKRAGWRAWGDLLHPPFFTLCSILLLLGHFLPWAAHATSALTQSGHDLAFSTHFTPGAGVFANAWFFTPAWCAALLLALAFTPALTSTVSRWERALWSVVFGGGAMLIASLGFPAYPQVLTALRSPDYRVQFFITLLTMFGVLALFLAPARRMPAQAPALIALACGALALIPVIGFLAVKPAVEALYGAPVGLGAGWWLTLVTSLLLIAIANAKMLRSTRH